MIDHKSARDVVTEVDHLSEALILDAIRRRFPGDGILAEESGAHRRAGRGAAGEAPSAAPRALAHGRTWVVDPLDGTINYANGIPYFCVSIGLVVDGVPSAGAVHDPMRGETFWASADGPAMLGERRSTRRARSKLSDFVVSMALGGRAVATRGAGGAQGRSGRRATPAPRRSRSRTSRTAGSTRSSSRAGCRRGTSPRRA